MKIGVREAISGGLRRSLRYAICRVYWFGKWLGSKMWFSWSKLQCLLDSNGKVILCCLKDGSKVVVSISYHLRIRAFSTLLPIETKSRSRMYVDTLYKSCSNQHTARQHREIAERHAIITEFVNNILLTEICFFFGLNSCLRIDVAFYVKYRYSWIRFFCAISQ